MGLLAMELFAAKCRGYAARRLKHVRTCGVLQPWLLRTRDHEEHYLARDIAARVIQRCVRDWVWLKGCDVTHTSPE